MNKAPVTLICGARVVENDGQTSTSVVVTPPGPELRANASPKCTKVVYYLEAKLSDTMGSFVSTVCAGQHECSLYWAPQDLLEALKPPLHKQEPIDHIQSEKRIQFYNPTV